jgi:hypothetical protein
VAAEGALERITSLGVDPEVIVRDVGLELADFGDPTNNISLAGYCRLLEVAAQRTARVAQRDVLEASLAE